MAFNRMLIQNLYLDLCLYRTYTYHRLMFIRDSRRSYRTYPYAELILITDLYLLRNYTYGRLILIGSYTYSSQILFLFGFLVYYTELIHVRILISSLCLFRSPVGVTEPMLIQRCLNTYWYLYLSQISRRNLQNS